MKKPKARIQFWRESTEIEESAFNVAMNTLTMYSFEMHWKDSELVLNHTWKLHTQ